jgi:predicted metal-dependent hydrolase
MSEARRIETPAGPALLRRTERHTLAISVLPDGSLELVAPSESTEAEIAARVAKRLRWIVRQRTAFAEMNRHRTRLRYESGATHTYLGRQYRLKVGRAESRGVTVAGSYLHVATRDGEAGEVERVLHAWLRERAREQFSARLAKWADWCRRQELPQPRLRLLRMRNRWGSSHQQGCICLNPELVRAPSICIDYVITHEVCHLKHPHHDQAFFKLLGELCPDWRTIKARLERL